MDIKVMTFNLRCDVVQDGINRWQNRTHLVKRAIAEESPDIIGFQEVMRHMQRDVCEMLSDEYTVLGTGRNADFGGEGVNIAFKKELFDLLYLDSFWLSDTPSVPGSFYTSLDQSTCPRMALVSGLAIKGTGKVLYFCNTHLDHLGENAREHGAALIIDRLCAKCTPDDRIVITGDMNATPDSSVIPIFCNKTLGLEDITHSLGSTFHNFGQRINEVIKIDYIFTNCVPCDKPSYLIDKYVENGVYCSDHYPVCGFVRI